MDVREALYTTRAMRRMRPDPIPRDIQVRLLDAAIRAPSGGNTQTWRFIIVDDKTIIARLAPLYREALGNVWKTVYKERIEQAQANPGDAASRTTMGVVHSAQHLADHLEDCPLIIFGLEPPGPSSGAIHIALWNAQLDARAEGIGSAIISALVLVTGSRTADILGIPKDCGYKLANAVAFGYPLGRWGVAPRIPVHEVAFRNSWGTPLGIEVNAPLWP